MKEKITALEAVLLKEGTPGILIEYIKEYAMQLSLEFRLITLATFLKVPADAETQQILSEMKAQKELLSSAIESLNISKKTKKACRRKGIETVLDACRYTYFDMRNLVGQYAARELEKYLGMVSLSFKDWEPDVLRYRRLMNIAKEYSDVKDIPMDHLCWYVVNDVRSVCNSMQIKTLGELSSKTENDLLSYDGCNQQTVREIKDLLREFDLSLKSEHEEKVPEKLPLPEKNSEVLSYKISDLYIPVRIKKVCELGNIKTIGDLVTYSSFDLLKIPGCGKKTIANIDDLLESMDLELRKSYFKRLS